MIIKKRIWVAPILKHKWIFMKITQHKSMLIPDQKTGANHVIVFAPNWNSASLEIKKNGNICNTHPSAYPNTYTMCFSCFFSEISHPNLAPLCFDLRKVNFQSQMSGFVWHSFQIFAKLVPQVHVSDEI